MKKIYMKRMAGCMLAIPLVLGVCTTVYAAKPEGKPGTPGVKNKPGKPSVVIEPEAACILKEMSAFLGSKKQFTFKANVSFEDILDDGQALLYDATVQAAVKRPNRLYAEYTDDEVDKRLWYDGKQVTLMNTRKKVYTDVTVPATIDEALDHLMAEYDMSLPLADLDRYRRAGGAAQNCDHI